jgi:hypothetical protein
VASARLSIPKWAMYRRYAGLLNRNPLDLVERNLVARAIIELRRARAGMIGHRLGVFERAAIGEIIREAGRAERVAAHFSVDAGLLREPSCATRRWPRPNIRVTRGHLETLRENTHVISALRKRAFVQQDGNSAPTIERQCATGSPRRRSCAKWPW